MSKEEANGSGCIGKPYSRFRHARHFLQSGLESQRFAFLFSDKNHILILKSKLPLGKLKRIKMKKIIKATALVALAVFTFSCGGSKKEDENFGKKETTEEVKPEAAAFPLAEKGKEIFEGKGTCATCHKIDIKLVGPSLQDIAKIYKEKNASIATFLKGDEKPIVDPTQFEVMKANFALTKNFTDEERQALEQYVLSEEK